MKQDVQHCWVPWLLLSSVLLGLGFKSQMGRLLQLPNELPAQTCSDAKENGLYYGETIPTPPPGPDPLPFPKALTIEPPESLPTIKLKEQIISVRDFMPDDLAFQPFEGYPRRYRTNRTGSQEMQMQANESVSRSLVHLTQQEISGQDKLDVCYKPGMGTSVMDLSCL